MACVWMRGAPPERSDTPLELAERAATACGQDWVLQLRSLEDRLAARWR